MKYTDAQRQAILAESHLLMEAGAGCGKTATLVGKVMHALGGGALGGAAEPCELEQIVAITFTEAAAADLKAALRKAFRDAAKDGDARWRRRVYELERARIGTIHAFCAGLLRDWGPRLGLDPGFRILDAVEGSLLRRDVVREVLFDVLRGGDVAAADLVAEYGFREVAGMLGWAASHARDAGEVLREWCPAGEPRLDELAARAAAAGRPWHPHDPQAVYHAATTLRLAQAVRAQADQRLAREGALDFDGLIDRVLDAVRAHPELVARFRQGLRWLFIDEFQDTDHAQKEIAYRLCALEGEPDAFAPRLCVVGDPKQSIYRFRGADISVWVEVSGDFEAHRLPVIQLTRNFRSRAPIVDYANATFARLMAEGGGDARHEVPYHALEAERDFPGDDALVEVLASAGGSAAERRRSEAEQIARRILELRAEECIRERDADGRERRRRPEWRDFALLFRARTGVAAYESAFRRSGIPFYLTSGGGFFGRPEVRDLVLLLTALSDPRDDLAWAGVLRSPWVGITDEGLMRLRLGRGLLSYAAREQSLPGPDGERLTRALAWLEELRGLRDRVLPSQLVERALDRSGYAATLLLQEDGDLALANLRKLVRMADAGQARPLGEVVGWLEERAEIADREAEARLHTAGEDVVAITTVHAAKGLEWPIVFLCDIEKDVLASRRPNLLFDLEEGLALRLKDRDQKEPAVAGGWERLAEWDERLALAEEKRIWYVAATRARDRLVLAGHVAGMTGKRTRVSQWMLAAAPPGDGHAAYEWNGRVYTVPVGAPVQQDGSGRPAPLPPTVDSLAGAAPLPPHVLRRLADPPPGRARRRHSATELMRLQREPREHHRVWNLGLPPHAPRAAAAQPVEGLTARSVGNIVHGVLERLREEEELDALLELEVLGEVGEEAAAALTLEARSYLRELIERTRSHPSIAPLYEAGAEPELAFTWLMPADGVPVAVRGAMDLVGRAHAGAEIVDYKSHAVPPGGEAEVASRYAVQRDVYAAALAELLGEDPSRVRFFFPFSGGEHVSPLSRVEIEKAKARVVALVAQVAGQRPDTPPPIAVQGDLFG